MKQSLRLGRVAGVPVGVHWSVLAILGLVAYVVAQVELPRADHGRPAVLYWGIAVPTAALFLGSLLAHEMAHAFVARRVGVRVRSVTLWLLGGVAQLEDDPPTPRAALMIAAVGPLTSVAAGAVFLLGASLAHPPALVAAALTWAGLMNVALAVFNLLPGAPLDGGRVLQATVWMWCHDRARADRVATRAGRILGASLAGVGLLETVLGSSAGLWLLVIGWFIASSAGAEATAAAAREAAAGLYVRDLMLADPDCAPADMTVRDFGPVAVLSRQSVFPVVAPGGEPVGIVTLDLLARLPVTRVGDLVGGHAAPLPPSHLSAPGDDAATLVNRVPLAGGLVAVVVLDGRVVGLVTSAEITLLLRRGPLRGRLVSPAPRQRFTE